MHCLIVSCVFAPEPVVSARTSTEVAEWLSKAGHQVTVIAPFPNRPGGKLYAGYKRVLRHQERSPDGYTLIRCYATFSQDSSMSSRFMENITFGISGALAALFVRRPDVIYANTWPVFASALLALVARVRRIPLVVSIQDVYPESLVAQGRTAGDSVLARFLRSIDAFVAASAAALVVISDTFAEIYTKTRAIAGERIAVIPNWLSSQTVTLSAAAGAELRARLGIPLDAPLAVYGGNIGVAAGVETLVQAMQHLPASANLHLLIAGDGSQLAECRLLAEQAPPGKVFFLSPWPAKETSAVLSAADILVLPTRGAQSLASVPSKLITYMLAAKPIVAQAVPGSELARTMDRAGCGFVVEPDSPEALARTLHLTAELPPQERADRAAAGRSYALQYMTTEANLPRLITVLESAAGGRD
jgi:glycosyltransferase involved in cell wall biosynthesis